MFGSHLSIAGGMVNALHEAQRLNFDTVQVFTKNQRQWRITPLDEAATTEWLAELARLGWNGRAVAHNSYLINLASPADGADGFYERSIALMREEFERAARLSIPYLVGHPGAHLIREGPLSAAERAEQGMVRIAKACKRLFRETRGYGVVLCLEATAGGGTNLGRSFEELARMRELILNEAGADADLAAGASPKTKAIKGGRVGFCVDTCHVLAAGYDISINKPSPPPPAGEIPALRGGVRGLASDRGGVAKPRKRTFEEGVAAGQALLAEFDRVCGIENLRVMHINDSKGALGSHIDRHAHIGAGQVALGAFAAIVGDTRLAQVPKILETPKEQDAKGRDMDSVNLAVLKRLAAKAAGK